jgi:drug/metabolite transporter (DMT)-like permease
MPRWLIYTVLTMLLWGGWSAVSKPLSSKLTAWEMQALSTIGLLPVILVLALSRSLTVGANPRRGFLQAFAAGLIVSAGNAAYFHALALGGKAAAVTPLTSLYPLVTVLLALGLLKERLNLVQATGIGLALLAIYVLNVGGETGFLSGWLAFALVPVLFWGVSALLQKLATQHASNELSTLAFLLGFIPVALLIPVFEQIHWHLTGKAWGLVILLGALFALGNLTLIFAYGSGGKGSIVTPMASLYSLVTIPVAMVTLDKRISSREWFGITFALCAVVALCHEKPDAAAEPAGVKVKPAKPPALF